jgi:hypothetical protein
VQEAAAGGLAECSLEVGVARAGPWAEAGRGGGNGGDLRLDAGGEDVDLAGQAVDLVQQHPGQLTVVSVERPVNASANAACLARILPLARPASVRGSRPPG